MDKAFPDGTVDDISTQDGVVDNLDALDISLSDQEIIGALHGRIEDSKSYWNSPRGYDLESVRNENVNLHLGKQVDKNALYAHQVPYVDNEIFVGVESILAYVTSQTPQPEVYPAQDSQESKILATDLEKVMLAHSDRFDLPRKMEGAVRNMLLKRVGFLKLRNDPFHGKNGDIVPEVVNPDNIIVDKNAAMGENPGFIAHVLKCSVDELVARFPKKKDEIFAAVGIVRGTPKQMGNTVVYREVWCTYWDNGAPKEGVVWYFKNVVLDKDLSPNWDYDNEDNNFLDLPVKPFIPFNYINDGSHWIDQTSPVEQAAHQQHILNKRGRQIVENADKANPTKVFAADLMDKNDAENLTGDPNQSIIVKGNDVNKAITIVQGQQLPNFVMDDKMDARQSVHNILGTPPQFTGAGQDKGATLGQDLMAKNQAQARQDAIVRAIDSAMNNYFKLLAQLMKVHYTEQHYFTINGGDGQFDYIAMSSEKIEPGTTIKVKSGTSLAFDKQRHQAVALQLAKLNRISTYDLYKDLQLDNPQKRYDNWMKSTTDPAALSSDIKGDEADRTAYIDFIEILAGIEVKPRDDIEPEHLLAHQKQLVTDKFMNADPEKQQALIQHIRGESDSLARRTEVMQEMAQQIAMDEQQNQPMGLGQVMNGPQGPGAPGQPKPPGGPTMVTPENTNMPNMASPTAMPTL